MHPAKNKRRQMANSFSRGFSLIELMIVVAILAMLAAIEYPSYQESIRKTKRAEGGAALMQLMQQQERYYSQNNTYVAFSAAAPNGFKWFSGNTAATSSYEISAAACQDDTIRNCVMLTAKPGTKNVNSRYTDDACMSLTLTSTGIKAAAGNAVNCWQ
ncbi:MAG: type pilin protein [Herminiimonas sp.]|nr:type pilin protein [Herminiimonas sp.]